MRFAEAIGEGGLVVEKLGGAWTYSCRTIPGELVLGLAVPVGDRKSACGMDRGTATEAAPHGVSRRPDLRLFGIELPVELVLQDAVTLLCQ